MDLIFRDDPAIEFNDVAEVGDGGPKKKAPVYNSSNSLAEVCRVKTGVKPVLITGVKCDTGV